MKPLCIDLFCGLGGWSEGFLAEGYECIGFDLERHEYALPEPTGANDGSKGTKPLEGRGWTQGCAATLGLEGSNARKRTRLVRYPGQLVLQDVLTLHGSQFRNAAIIVASPPCQRYSWMAQPWKRAKREASWQRWERSSPFGNFHLNDLFDVCFRIQREASEAAGRRIPLVVENVKGAQPWVGPAQAVFGSFYLWGDVARVGNRVVMPEAKFGAEWTQAFKRDGHPCNKLTDSRYGSHAAENKQPVWFNDDKRRAEKCGGDRFGSGADCSLMRSMGSKSNARKAASALIAKIPGQLSSYIARCYKPVEEKVS